MNSIEQASKLPENIPPAKSQYRDPEPLKALVVDGKILRRSTLRNHLAEGGYSVHTARSEAVALELIANYEYSLVVASTGFATNMPDKSFRELSAFDKLVEESSRPNKYSYRRGTSRR